LDAAPTNADAGRGELFRAYLRSRPAAYVLVLGSGAAFVVGAWKQSPLIMAAAPGAVALAVVGIAFVLADRAAAQRFYSSFAASLRLLYVGDRELLPLTPLLGAGDRRRCLHWMEGALSSEPPLRGGLGHFMWEELERRRGSSGHERTEVEERHQLTLCVVDLEPSMALFKGLYLHPRRGLLGLGDGWLSRSGTRSIEVESTAFTQRYELRVADDQDEGRARQLLAPSLVSWLAGHPLAPGFELKAGTLAVFVMRPLEDAGNLTYLLDAARHLAGRVLREVEERITLTPQ
jgi:hypothetical protein